MTSDKPPIRVMVADDHDLIRRGLARFLRHYDDIVVVAEAASGREAIEAYGLHRPDVVLMDLIMPEINGLEATRVIRQRFPQACIILMSALHQMYYSDQAAESGVVAYLEKSNLDEIADKVREVHGGVG